MKEFFSFGVYKIEQMCYNLIAGCEAFASRSKIKPDFVEKAQKILQGEK